MPDWLGLFANASFGVEDIVAQHKAANDDYSYIMAEALADRLAEAFAEKLHQIMRKEVRPVSQNLHPSPPQVSDKLEMKACRITAGLRHGSSGGATGPVYVVNIPTLSCGKAASLHIDAMHMATGVGLRSRGESVS